jgi:hypothetical protein
MDGPETTHRPQNYTLASTVRRILTCNKAIVHTVLTTYSVLLNGIAILIAWLMVTVLSCVSIGHCLYNVLTCMARGIETQHWSYYAIRHEPLRCYSYSAPGPAHSRRAPAPSQPPRLRPSPHAYAHPHAHAHDHAHGRAAAHVHAALVHAAAHVHAALVHAAKGSDAKKVAVAEAQACAGLATANRSLVSRRYHGWLD